MMWRYDERFSPGSQPFFYGCAGFILLFVLQIMGGVFGPAGIVGGVALTLIAGAIMTLWLTTIVVRGASGQIGALHAILGFTEHGRRFFGALAFIPFFIFYAEYTILHTKLGPNAFVDVTGWKISREAVMFTAVLFTLVWLFNLIVLWFQVKAMRTSTTRYCLQCGHVLDSTTQKCCTECGFQLDRMIKS